MAEGLDFGLLGGKDNLQTADYRSAGSHQAENISYIQNASADTYEDIHTVTVGKTYYVSGLIITLVTGGTALAVTLATGNPGSEVPLLVYAVNTVSPLSMGLITPIKFSSGTRIRVKSAGAITYINLIGWEE